MNMAKYLWLTWDGAGNLPPSLAIAEALTKRGDTVTFAGRPEMVSRVQAAGFKTIVIENAYTQADTYPKSLLSRMACYLSSPRVSEEIVQIVEAHHPDVVVVDAMFPAALAQVSKFNRATIMTCYTFFHRAYHAWKKQFDEFIAMREEAGLGRLPGMEQLWRGPDRIVVATLEEFDRPAIADAPTQVQHVGPILGGHNSAIAPESVRLPPGTEPLALVSFSTAGIQNSVEKFQRALNALASLPLRVVVTTANTIDAKALEVPANAVVVDYADHEALLPDAALVVTHGGHGTAMRTLKYGVPAIIMPSLAQDQPVIAATFEEWGCGLSLPSDASVDAIQAAAKKVLSTPSFRKNAQARAGALAKAQNGAEKAADVFQSIAQRDSA
jgi:MGT family glycosyltransferase